MPKLCSNYVQMQTRLHMSCIEMDVLPCDWAYDAQKMNWAHYSCAGLDSDIPSENEATSHIEFILPYLCWVWMNLRKLNMVYGIIITRYLSRRYQKRS